MAGFKMEDVEKYSNGGGGSYFTLKDDKDTARVRFLYDTMDDVEGTLCHEVTMSDGRKRYVECLRTYDEPIEKCPFCGAKYKVIPKLFIQLYNEDAGEVQVWERGKRYFEKLASLCARYNPLRDKLIEIERQGKKGDMKTEYNFYPLDDKCEKLDVEHADIIGTMVLSKTADEMNYYLENDKFEGDSSQQSSNEEYPSSGRRTPAVRSKF